MRTHQFIVKGLACGAMALAFALLWSILGGGIFGQEEVFLFGAVFAPNDECGRSVGLERLVIGHVADAFLTDRGHTGEIPAFRHHAHLERGGRKRGIIEFYLQRHRQKFFPRRSDLVLSHGKKQAVVFQRVG